MIQRALQFKITLNNTQPEVWRRIQILEGASLRTLHYTIQDVFWWRGVHSYIFNIGDEKYADPEYDYEFEGWLDDSKFKIGSIVEKHTEFEFVYDFGDWWSHKVIFEGAVNADLKEKYPVCIGGKYAAPPEDCGGPPGFDEFRKAMTNPKDRKHRELAEWFSHTNFNQKYDPDFFNIELTNLRVGRRQKPRILAVTPKATKKKPNLTIV